MRPGTMEVLKEERVAGESLENIQRRTAKHRAALVLQVVMGETSAQEAARKHGPTVAEVEDWKEKFLPGAENALRSRPRDEAALRDQEVKRLKQKIGELVLDNDILREASNPYRPSEARTSDERRTFSRTLRFGAFARRSRFRVPRSNLEAGSEGRAGVQSGLLIPSKSLGQVTPRGSQPLQRSQGRILRAR